MNMYNTIVNSAVIVALIGSCTVEPNVEASKEQIIIDPSPILVLASNQPSVTRDEKLELVKLLYLEAGVQSKECKEMVAGVVMNRLRDGRWGSTLHDVIFSDGQFEVAHLIPRTEPFICREAPYYEKSQEFIGNWEDCYSVADQAVSRGMQIPPYVMYFSSGAPFDWPRYKVYTVIDGMYFGYLEEDM